MLSRCVLGCGVARYSSEIGGSASRVFQSSAVFGHAAHISSAAADDESKYGNTAIDPLSSVNRPTVSGVDRAPAMKLGNKNAVPGPMSPDWLAADNAVKASLILVIARMNTRTLLPPWNATFMALAN